MCVCVQELNDHLKQPFQPKTFSHRFLAGVSFLFVFLDIFVCKYIICVRIHCILNFPWTTSSRFLSYGVFWIFLLRMATKPYILSFSSNSLNNLTQLKSMTSLTNLINYLIKWNMALNFRWSNEAFDGVWLQAMWAEFVVELVTGMVSYFSVIKIATPFTNFATAYWTCF